MTIVLSQLFASSSFALAWLQEEAALDFTIMGMLRNLGGVALAVVVILLIMSIWSIAIMVERFLTYNAAKNQSREFAPKVATALKQSKIDDAIGISEKYKKSHLAMVVNAGLQEFRAHQVSTDISGEEIDASKRALQRAEAIKVAEFKRGLSGLATIGSTAPFVGLFGTVWGILNALTAIGIAGQASIDRVAGPVGEALIMTALGLAVAVPAVLCYNLLVRRNKVLNEKFRSFSNDLQTYLLSSKR